MAQYCHFDSAFVFKYSPRFGTPAFEMHDMISKQIKTERFLVLEKVLRKSQQIALQDQLNKTFKVLAERISSKNNREMTGHTTCHKIVNFKGADVLLGDIVNVKITECKKNSLYGEVC